MPSTSELTDSNSVMHIPTRRDISPSLSLSLSLLSFSLSLLSFSLSLFLSLLSFSHSSVICSGIFAIYSLTTISALRAMGCLCCVQGSVQRTGGCLHLWRSLFRAVHHKFLGNRSPILIAVYRAVRSTHDPEKRKTPCEHLVLPSRGAGWWLLLYTSILVATQRIEKHPRAQENCSQSRNMCCHVGGRGRCRQNQTETSPASWQPGGSGDISIDTWKNRRCLPQAMSKRGLRECEFRPPRGWACSPACSLPKTGRRHWREVECLGGRCCRRAAALPRGERKFLPRSQTQRSSSPSTRSRILD